MTYLSDGNDDPLYDYDDPNWHENGRETIENFFGSGAEMISDANRNQTSEDEYGRNLNNEAWISEDVDQQTEKNDAELETIKAEFKFYYRKSSRTNTQKIGYASTFICCTAVFKISKDGGRKALKQTLINMFYGHTLPYKGAHTGALSIHYRDRVSNGGFDVTIVGYGCIGKSKEKMQNLADSKIKECRENIIVEWKEMECELE